MLFGAAAVKVQDNQLVSTCVVFKALACVFFVANVLDSGLLRCCTHSMKIERLHDQQCCFELTDLDFAVILQIILVDLLHI